jgi:predicted esterase
MHNARIVQQSKAIHRTAVFFLTSMLLIIRIIGVTFCWGMDRATMLEVGYLGVGAIQSENNGLKVLLVAVVKEGGPGDKAGIKVGDIILDIDGQKFDNPASFLEYMNKTKAGQKLKVTVLRNGKQKKISVTLSKPSPDSMRNKLKNRLGLSLREQAQQELEQKNLDDAIDFYTRWLAADPQDYGSWYDLACVYASKGDKDKALEAFENAVDAGWENTEQAKNDSNLVAIRDENRFKQALELCNTNIRIDVPDGYKRHVIEMKSLGSYIVLLPPDYDVTNKEYPLCLILHGMGSTELWHGKLGDELGREGVIYVVPRAAYPYLEEFGSQPVPTWSAWPSYLVEGHPDYTPSESLYKKVDELNAEWIFACGADARKRYRVQGEKVFILGHSQGAFLANVCAILHPELVESYFAYAGFIPDVYLGNKYLEGLKDNKVRVYLAHGTEDKVIDPNESVKAEKAMKAAGVDCTLKTFKTEHPFATEVYSFAKEWLNTEVRSNKD